MQWRKLQLQELIGRLSGSPVWTRFQLFAAWVSDRYQLKPGSDSPEIPGIAGQHGLLGPLGTNDDVGIDDVCCSGSCQQQAHSRRFWSVEGNQIRADLTN